MLRRTLVITAAAVAISAAAAFAFVPRLSRTGHGWSIGGLWTGRGYTPDPQTRNPLTASGEVQLENGNGTPGTYCPIPPRSTAASPATRPAPADSAFETGASSAGQSKADLLQPPPAANCAPPAASTPAPRTSLP